MGVNVKTSFSTHGKQGNMTGQNREYDRSQVFSRIIRNAEHFSVSLGRDFRSLAPLSARSLHANSSAQRIAEWA